ncbi:MAG: hypothetical protein H0W72_01455 [Planctomycetes bacterium]|nr:hypothetical protein [Planctomycetota bacterium]
MRRPASRAGMAIGAISLFATFASLPVIAAETAVSATAFVADAQFDALTNAVTSLRGDYAIEYRLPDKPTEIERRITIKEWMTRESTRIEVVGEVMEKGKPRLDRKELWITTPERSYFYDALTKAMTVSVRSEEIATTFSNPLALRAFFAGKLFRDGELQPLLANLTSSSYRTMLEQRMSVEKGPDGAVTISEKNNPANHSRYVFRYLTADAAMPTSIDAWGDRITMDEKGEFVRTPAKLAVYRISASGEVRAGSTVLPYPKEIEWQDSEGKVTFCLIRVTKLKVNEAIDPDLFVPDMTIADRIDDDTAAPTPKE